MTENKFKAVDAKTPLFVDVFQKIIPRCKQADPENCVLAVAGREQHHMDYFIVHRSVAYGKFHNDPKTYRWMVSGQGNLLLGLWDMGIYKTIPKDGLTFKFMPPVGVRSKKYLRSEQGIELRRQSQRRRKGKKKRGYRSPDPKTLAGVRGGHFGYFKERGK